MSTVLLWPGVVPSLCRYIFFKGRRRLLIYSPQPWQWALGCVIKTKRGTISQTERRAWKRTTGWAGWQRERDRGGEMKEKERVPVWDWNTHLFLWDLNTDHSIPFHLVEKQHSFLVGSFDLRPSTFSDMSLDLWPQCVRYLHHRNSIFTRFFFLPFLFFMSWGLCVLACIRASERWIAYILTADNVDPSWIHLSWVQHHKAW